MKKEYISPDKRFVGVEIKTIKELSEIEELNNYHIQSMTETLNALIDGKADEFFEENLPFATWLIPAETKDHNQKIETWWQIEKTALSSFSIEKVYRSAIIATIEKKYVVPLRKTFETAQREDVVI